MSTPIFKDKSIISENTSTWPKSPDREHDNKGRKQYSNSKMKNALKSNPSQAVNLSDYSDFLKPYESDKNGLYKKDPVSDLINNASKKNLFFNDDKFSPSIFWDGKSGKIKHGRIKELITLPTMHILDVEKPEFFPISPSNLTDINLEVKHSPTIMDMSQEGLENCGFVASMGCIALHPQGHNLLFSAIYPPVYNPLGIYSVRLLFDSEIRYMLIDDQIPDQGYSYMSSASEFWYLLIEKTFAKLCGGYSKLAGGMEKYLGLMSSSNLDITMENKETVWQEFLSIFQDLHSTTYQGTSSHVKHLATWHAYSIIDAAEWAGIRLVRLHNPWNLVDYRGPFSPDSSDWHKIPEDIQKKLFQVDRFKKLSFWMPYDLYLEDIPKISNIYLNEKIPNCLKEIANPNSIQD